MLPQSLCGVPVRCEHCDRYCDGKCPVASQLALIASYAESPEEIPVARPAFLAAKP